MADGSVEFYLELKYTSEGAYLFTDGTSDIWIPKSQILEMNKVKGNDYEIEIPYWLAKAKEMI